MSEVASESLVDKWQLKADVLAAARWATGMLLTSRALLFVRTLIAARLLGPHELGLFGAAALATGVAETLSQPGLHAAVIQRQELDPRSLHTVWTLQVLRGILLALGLVVAAPLVGTLFHDASIASLIRVLAIGSLIRGLTNLGVVLLEKELNFRRQFQLSVMSALSDALVSALALLVAKNAWALVAGALAGSVMRLAASYRLHPYRPRIRVDLAAARVLFRYGRWISASGMLIFLIGHVDDMAAGYLLGPYLLGIYQMAFRVINVPATELQGLIATIAFPAYSRIQRDVLLLRKAFRRLTYGVLSVTVPVTGWLVALLGPLTTLFLGSQWSPMVPVGQILSLFVVARLVGWSAGPLYQAVGRPDYITKLGVVQLVLLMFLLTILAPRGGLIGIAWAVVLPMLITQAVGLVMLSRLVSIPLADLIWGLTRPVVATLAAAAVAILLARAEEPVWSVVVGSGAFLAAYGVLYEVVAHFTGGTRLRALAQDVLQSSVRPRIS